MRPLLTWRDTRAAGYVDVLEKRLDREDVHRRTGCPLHASYWPAKLAWLADAEPDLMVLNTDCNAEPPHDLPTSDGRGPTGNGPDPRGVEVVDIPKTALSQCKSDHRVYLNKPDGGTGPRAQARDVALDRCEVDPRHRALHVSPRG